MKKRYVFLYMSLYLFPYHVPAATIYDPGIEYCQTNPTNCGLETGGSYNNGYTQAKVDCKQNPSSCEITITDTNGSTADGITQCKQNPSSCEITITDTNGSTTDGIAQCQQSPASCGITDNNGSTAQGIAQCQQSPASCGITDSNGSTEDGIAKCKLNPASCMIPMPIIVIPDGVDDSLNGLILQLPNQSRFIPLATAQAYGMESLYEYRLTMRKRADGKYVFDIGLLQPPPPVTP